ncbi:MAG TPA: hypothetical protein VM123_16615 [archaeon]|nr:hypothetical protein [archaeon]
MLYDMAIAQFETGFQKILLSALNFFYLSVKVNFFLLLKAKEAKPFLLTGRTHWSAPARLRFSRLDWAGKPARQTLPFQDVDKPANFL